MQRVDLAEKVARQMCDVDDDDALSQLALSWVLIAKHSSSSLTEAFNTLTEVAEKAGPSPVVLSLLAVTQLLQQKAREGFQYLRQARELARANGHPATVDTLVNSAVCMFHRGSVTPAADDVLSKVLEELKQAHPGADWFAKEAAASALFDKCAANYN